MNKVLVLFVHPNPDDLKINSEFMTLYKTHDHVAFCDLYEEYPDFNIIVMHEQKRMVYYDTIVLHFPLIWYGIPPLLKLWIDEVFDMEWLQKEGDFPFQGKVVHLVVSVEEKYQTLKGNTGEPFQTTDYLKTLSECMNVSKMTSGRLITINNIDKLNEQEREKYYLEVQNILNGS